MSQVTQIRLGGFGGQGIVLAGILLGHAGTVDGRWVTGANSYGAQARGSVCHAEVVLSDEPVDFPRVLEADILVAMSQGVYDHFVEGTKERGLIIYDSHFVKPNDSRRLHRSVDATGVAAREMGNKQVANILMLGALTALTKIVSRTSMESAISNHVPERFKRINLLAVKRGFQLGETFRK
jgi:2-oxoglutarate ferredoxin oxidoreductase subunit gamma